MTPVRALLGVLLAGAHGGVCCNRLPALSTNAHCLPSNAPCHAACLLCIFSVASLCSGACHQADMSHTAGVEGCEPQLRGRRWWVLHRERRADGRARAEAPQQEP